MLICTTIASLRNALRHQPPFDKKLGFVPTMGALHQGHIQLVNACSNTATFTVASIFINPTQFNDPADFARYPKSLEQDIDMLEKAGCDLLFIPTVQEMYPDGLQEQPSYNLGPIEILLEGKYRPGHFQGVCVVVHKLLSLVRPGLLFMGQKDFQQCMVVSRMLEITRLPVEMKMIPTVREPDGLAMSSRNRRLTPMQREIASAIYQQLISIKAQYKHADLRLLEKEAAAALLEAGFSSVDYVSIANARTLQPLPGYLPTVGCVVLVAAYLGAIRLIDNLPLVS